MQLRTVKQNAKANTENSIKMGYRKHLTKTTENKLIQSNNIFIIMLKFGQNK